MSSTENDKHYVWDRFDESIVQGRAEKTFSSFMQYFEEAKKNDESEVTIVLPLDADSRPDDRDEKTKLYDEKLKEKVLEMCEEEGFEPAPMGYELDEQENPIGVCYKVVL